MNPIRTMPEPELEGLFADGALLHDAFVAQAAATPDAVAVVARDRTLTYGELDDESNRLANALVSAGAVADARVGIYVDRTADMLVALFGVLKSGASYIPIDPSFPASRIEIMLEDGAPVAVVTQGWLAAGLPADTDMIVVDDPDASWRTSSAHLPTIATRPEHLAYTIFTSGSTGRPKGVQVEHGNVVNFLTSMAAEPGFTATDTIIAVTTLSFDIAVLELFLPLSVGGTIHLATRDVAADAFALAEMIDAVAPTVLQATPATFQMLLAGGWKGLDGLKVLCGGEALPRVVADQLLDLDLTVWNMYGPTETTVWSSVHEVVAGGEGPVPLGVAVRDTELYVVDESLQPVPAGEIGELVIGGGGVTRGYLDRPELTAEKFVADQLGPDPQRRLYRTGDLARYHDDGTLEFLGRNDHQVKMRGYRIELTDIEAALLAHGDVATAACVLRHSAAGDPYLAGFYAPGQGQTPPDVVDVRAHLRDRLPEYMVPAYLVALPAIPLTPNNKVDRLSLPDVDLSAQRGSAEVVAARTPLEQKLCDLWQELLGVPTIGIHDNFFDLGGNSLLAVRLFSRLESDLDTDFALTDLMAASTVAALGDLIEARTDGAGGYHPLVPIQPGDRARHAPLYIVHGAGGNVLGFTETARALPDDLPFIGIQARGVDGLLAPHDSIEAMGAEYAEAIAADTDGPIRIAGYSGGGLAALAAAQQLRAAGRDVEALILIDTYPPTAQPRQLTWRDRQNRLRTYGLRGVVRSIQRNRERQGRLERHAEAAHTYQVGVDRLPHELREGRLVAAFNQAEDQYVPPHYDGTIEYLEVDEVWPVYDHVEAVAYWTDRCDDIVVHTVPGDHFTVVDPPNATELAAALVAASGATPD